MKIVLSDPHSCGGGQVRYVANLASELVRRGHGAAIACRPDSVLIQTASQAGAALCGPMHFPRGLRLARWCADLRSALRYIQQEKPSIIHVSGSQDHWLFSLANMLAGFPACVIRTRHNTYPVRNTFMNRLLNQRWTDFQIVVCEEVRAELARQPAFDPQRMSVIHNGVDAEAFKPDPDMRKEARAEFGYAPGDFVCGIAARLVKAKGHAYLFRAVQQLLHTMPQLRILALGTGVLEHQLRSLVDELGITACVHFAGFRDDMARCVHAFDIGVQPSIDCDTSSFSLKEQMAAGIPVVASNYGGLPEIIQDGVEGYIIPAGSVEPLADAIARLASAPGSMARMGEAGRLRVLREFTIDSFASKTIAAYERALAIHQERRPSGSRKVQ